ncbi:uncharacterized protein BJX67DRAFT_373614 [Aspergillus lucknowensis]|uniref:Uncharacterized protein n=1 Tax=Aspergillus lucknowensis TaxID=176173 RepID=A0ABR4LJR6_9EURO
MVHSDPDERLVYLACQHIFSRPCLICLSPAQSAEQEASGAEATRDEANTLREISEKEGSRDIIIKSQTQTTIEEKEELTVIRRLVEEGRFTYAQRRFPQLQVNGWDCLEVVELTKWIKVLSQYSYELVTIEKPLDELFSNLRALRHSPVHRLRKTAIGVERLAENAQLFLETLDEVDRSERVSRLRGELKTAVEELQRNKDLLEGIVYYVNLRVPTKEEGKGKERMVEERPELSNSNQEFVESVVPVNSVDCQPAHL